MGILSLVREESGLAKFWVSEQRLVDQANTIRRKNWMTGLEIEQLEKRVTGSDNVIVAEARSVQAFSRRRGKCFAGNARRRAG